MIACLTCVDRANFQKMLPLRLWWWLTRKEMIPADHRPGCPEAYFGRCSCPWHRAPHLREALTGTFDSDRQWALRLKRRAA